MSSAFNHKSRSRKTYRYHLAAARYYCNYNLTRAERLMMQARFAAPASTKKTEEVTENI